MSKYLQPDFWFGSICGVIFPSLPYFFFSSLLFVMVSFIFHGLSSVCNQIVEASMLLFVSFIFVSL